MRNTANNLSGLSNNDADLDGSAWQACESPDEINEENHEQGGHTADNTTDVEIVRKKRKLEKLKAKKLARAKVTDSYQPDVSTTLVGALRGDSAEKAAAAFWTALLSTPAGLAMTSLERAHALAAHHLVLVPDAALRKLAAPLPKPSDTFGAAPSASAVSFPAAGAQAAANAMYARIATVDELAEFIKSALSESGRWKGIVGWKHAPEKLPMGSPAVLIITYSARRAADMLKPLASFQCRVAKLFAKHMNFAEQVAALSGGPPTPLAVGTPSRLLALAEAGVLSLERCELLIWDTRQSAKGETALTPLPVGRVERELEKIDRGESVEQIGSLASGGAVLATASWAFYAKFVHPRLMGFTVHESSDAAHKTKPTFNTGRSLRMAFY